MFFLFLAIRISISALPRSLLSFSLIQLISIANLRSGFKVLWGGTSASGSERGCSTLELICCKLQPSFYLVFCWCAYFQILYISGTFAHTSKHVVILWCHMGWKSGARWFQHRETILKLSWRMNAFLKWLTSKLTGIIASHVNNLGCLESLFSYVRSVFNYPPHRLYYRE